MSIVNEGSLAVVILRGFLSSCGNTTFPYLGVLPAIVYAGMQLSTGMMSLQTNGSEGFCHRQLIKN